MGGPAQPHTYRVYVCGDYCFIPFPAPRSMGLWLRGHRSIAYVDCPRCGAKRFAPCLAAGPKGNTIGEPAKHCAYAHRQRRHAYQREKPSVVGRWEEFEVTPANDRG